MNIRSLSFRLTTWTVASFLAATLLAFIGFYLATQKILIAHTDSNLVTHAVKVAQVVSAQEIGMHDTLAKEAFIRQFSEIPGMLVVIMDSQGVVVSSSTAYGPDAALYDYFYQARKSNRPFFATAKVGLVQMHVYVVPVIKADTLAAVVLVGHPVDVISQSLKSLALVLSAVFLALVVPVALGGYLLVKKGLLPVSNISAAIAKIESSNLSARIPIPQTGDQLAQLASAFNSLLERLAASFTRERQFIGDVAHEVKTPLSIISGTAEVALSKPRSKPDYQKALAEILTDTGKISSTLRNVMDLAWSQSYGERSRTTAVWESFSLSEMIEELAEVAVKLAQSKNITVKSKIEKEIILTGKRDKLYRAVLNLIDNAIKFTPHGGKISLSLVSQSGVIKIVVSDTGVGIVPADLPYIFDRFYRGSKTGQTLGSGLGLAIASSIIAAHNGKIEVKSTLGKGSQFVVFLTKS